VHINGLRMVAEQQQQSEINNVMQSRQLAEVVNL
jgi:hypothetical protein